MSFLEEPKTSVGISHLPSASFLPACVDVQTLLLLLEHNKNTSNLMLYSLFHASENSTIRIFNVHRTMLKSKTSEAESMPNLQTFSRVFSDNVKLQSEKCRATLLPKSVLHKLPCGGLFRCPELEGQLLPIKSLVNPWIRCATDMSTIYAQPSP